MKQRRIRRDGLAHYHCMTRVVNRDKILGEVEKEYLRLLIRRVEGFTGVTVLTYAIMSNHLHVLLEEPDITTDVSDEMLLERLASLYTEEEMGEILERWERWEAMGNTSALAADKARYRLRMHNISEFMGQVKHRFSCWYNRVNGRKGTLWEERFRSVLVQSGDALRIMAAYIELNPVRGGMVTSPADYRFCGFGEAVGGGTAARHGIMSLARLRREEFGEGGRTANWYEDSALYYERVLMYGEARDCGMLMSMMDEKVLREKLGRRIELTPFERLMCRCRYFSYGQVIGDKEFVELFFEEFRDLFSAGRTSGGRKVRGGWMDLFAVRDVGWMGWDKDKGGDQSVSDDDGTGGDGSS